MSVNRERSTRDEEVCTLYFDHETLESARDQLDRLIKEYGKDAKIRSYCDSYSDSDKEYLHVVIQRPETDKEMAERIRREEQNEAHRLASERQLYKALKKKFES